MAATPASGNNLGFLSVFQEGNSYIGGYLVVNSWGRPLEFRLSSAVQPNKVQQILYGDTLAGYLCGEVIAKTLIDKSTTPVQWVLLDNPQALDLRLCVEMPVALWCERTDPEQAAPGLLVKSQLYCDRRFPQDVDAIRELSSGIGTFDFGEPFIRIREALGEARKLGVASRMAA
jgi:hypothetical protein